MIPSKRISFGHWGKHALLFYCLCAATHCRAQPAAVHWGITAQPAVKLPFLPAGNDVYSIWGNAGLGLAAIIEGEEENALSLSLKAGVSLDFTRYKIPATGTCIVDRGSIYFNPEVLFPTGKERLKIAAGFGAEFNGYFLAQMSAGGGNITLEEATKIEDAKRKALAFLSAGLQYDLKHDFVLQLVFRQMLMDVFRGETTISYAVANGEERAKLNLLPTCFGIGISYFFGKN
jgi:hypothetical protein